MRIAFVVGHHKDSKGAYSPYLGMSEWDFYSEVLSNLKESNVFFHNPKTKGYTNRVKETAAKLDKMDFNLVIALHFNAAETPQANGCETLYYYKSKKGREYASLFSQTVQSWTGIKSRNGGLKSLTQKKDRGFAAVYYPKAPVILIEPFFGSNKADCKKIKNAEYMACIINDFISQIIVDDD
jgi:N-acetylmuramoyl-L-alanine amidase